MILARPYTYLALGVKRNLKLVMVLALIGLALGVGTHLLLGGRAAMVGGRIQFITVVIYIFLALVLVLFTPQQGRVGAIMRSIPFQLVAILLCTVLGAFTLYSVIFTVKSILQALA